MDKFNKSSYNEGIFWRYPSGGIYLKFMNVSLQICQRHVGRYGNGCRLVIS